nr:hypothetical protein CFP56_31703 [Quercus suber]
MRWRRLLEQTSILFQSQLSPVGFFTDNATASADYSNSYPRSSPLPAARSPDTASPVYPERAIRPLPRSRLKSKLSPQQATSIIYPPEPPPLSPTLHFSTAPLDVDGTPPTRLANGSSYASHHDQDEELLHNHCTCGDHGESADEVEFDHPHYRYATATLPVANGSHKPLDSVQQRLLEASRISAKPPPPGSTASSADGYESFENTSNKKKRKIPLSSASSMHQSQLSAEMANMGISQPESGSRSDSAVPEQYSQIPASTVAGTGISGAGRGRYGRQNGKHERRPLVSSSLNAANGYHARPPARSPLEIGEGNDAVRENTGGIISKAIKSAAEQGPLTPQKGQDTHISLLQSAASSSTATPKTQFTFSCESESATKMVDEQAVAAAYATPSPAGVPMHYRSANGHPVHSVRGMNTTQGTQTTPPLRQGPPGVHSRAPPPTANYATGQPPPPAPAPRPKPRRRPSKEYALAARQRQLQQEYTNYHHRPVKDNMYICEFCEYEDIFGVKPVAMIRHYEIKDRQERKKAAEKRRLLEKAKMKNRKGKKGKGGKNNHSNNHSGAAPPPAQGHVSHGGQHYDPNLPPGGAEGDEYFEEDEYGDDYEPVDGDPYHDGLGDPGYYPPPVSNRPDLHPPVSTPAAARPGAVASGGMPMA